MINNNNHNKTLKKKKKKKFPNFEFFNLKTKEERKRYEANSRSTNLATVYREQENNPSLQHLTRVALKNKLRTKEVSASLVSCCRSACQSATCSRPVGSFVALWRKFGAFGVERLM